jgi:uncharacterized repeat protein (TIGR01451 family)
MNSKNVLKFVSTVLIGVLILNGLVFLPSCAPTPEPLNPLERIDSLLTNADENKASGDIAAEKLELTEALDIALENNLPEKREIIETKLSDNSRREGDSHRRVNNYDNAEESYKDAIDYDSDNPWPYIGLIIIGVETGDHETAVHYAQTLDEAELTQETISDFPLDTQTAEEYKNYVVTFNNNGTSMAQTAETIDVIETGTGYFKESLAISEALDAAGIENTPTATVVNNLVSAGNNLIVLNAQAGDFNAAKDAAGNTLEIIEDYEQIVSETITSTVLSNTAIVYAISGDYDIAIEYARASLTHNPDSAVANNIMGASLTALGGEENVTAALPYIETAAELDPGNGLYQDNLRTIQGAIASGVYEDIVLNFGVCKKEEIGSYVHIFGIRGGRVKVKFAGEGEWIQARKCMRLPYGSLIETGLGGRAYIKYIEKGKRVAAAVVKPLTQLTVKKKVVGEKVTYDLKLKIGAVRVRVDKTALEAGLRVATPSITAAVAGTSFEVSYNDTTNTSLVEVFDGSVNVTNLATGETVVITGYGNGTGQRATVHGDTITVVDIEDMDASAGGEWDFDAMFEE